MALWPKLIFSTGFWFFHWFYLVSIWQVWLSLWALSPPGLVEVLAGAIVPSRTVGAPTDGRALTTRYALLAVGGRG